MKPQVEVQYATGGESLPPRGVLATWVAAALGDRREPAQVSIRIVGEAEGARLNREYRGRGGPTNVLSFPFEALPGVDLPLLGDIVICAPVVAREAREQGKPERAHWAHLVVHGTLHLLGYDHTEAAEALAMEQTETRILLSLGFAAPYEETDD